MRFYAGGSKPPVLYIFVEESIMLKKAFFVSLLTVISLSVVFAGGSRASTQAQSSGPVRLTVAIPENLAIQDYETNYMTRILEREANVDLDFVVFSSVDYNTRLNLMVMAGGAELPDILLGGGGSSMEPMVYQWAREGAIIPLTKYYRDPALSPWIHDAINRSGENYLPLITAPDGEIYGIAGGAQSIHAEFLDRLFYYEPWLRQLGLKAPETTEEFRNVLRAVVRGDPNGNGRADEIGFLGDGTDGTFKFLMNSFVYCSYTGDWDMFNVNNGVLSVAYNKPEWREGLKYIRSLVQEGLIPVENLTMDYSQYRALINIPEQRVFSLGTQGINDMTDDSRAEGYVGALPLRGPAGVQYASFKPTGWYINFVVSKNCRNPDAAFKVGDLLHREDISITSRYGQEGVDWDYWKNLEGKPGFSSNDYSPYVAGFPLFIYLYDDRGFWNSGRVSNASWRGIGPSTRTYIFESGLAVPKTGASIREMERVRILDLYYRSNLRPGEVVSKLVYNENETSFMADLRTSLRNYVEEMTSAFLAGNRDIDGYWNTYLAELNNIGLARFLSTNQTVYNRMYRN